MAKISRVGMILSKKIAEESCDRQSSLIAIIMDAQKICTFISTRGMQVTLTLTFLHMLREYQSDSSDWLRLVLTCDL